MTFISNFGYGFLIRPDHVASDKNSVNMGGCVGYACEWEGVSDSPDHVASDKKLCTFNKEFSDCTFNRSKKHSFIIWVIPVEKLSSDLPAEKFERFPQCSLWRTKHVATKPSCNSRKML